MGGAVVGYITSAAWSPTQRACLAYAWLPADLEDGVEVSVAYQRTTYRAVLGPDVSVDPAMSRIRK